MLRVTAIHRYPVKSLRGHAIDQARIERCGIVGDRRWMVVDRAGRFVTRREAPAMALVDVVADGDDFVLSHPDIGACRVSPPDRDAPTISATVWRDSLEVRVAGADAAAFLSRAIGRTVRLVHQAAADNRPVDPRFGHADDRVSLADGYPLLVTTGASLAALNARLPMAIGMDRFRPNLVIDGAAAWDEDGWRRLRIGDVVLRLAKPCSRCVITTQDALTGQRDQGDEPLATLRAMGRMRPGGIMFGDNVIPETTGIVRAGDPVEILDRL